LSIISERIVIDGKSAAQPPKRDLKRRFKLVVVRGKPRMVEIK